jgi:hypothetical protein
MYVFRVGMYILCKRLMCYELCTLFTRICGKSNNDLNSYSNAGSPNTAKTPRNALINANECIPKFSVYPSFYHIPSIHSPLNIHPYTSHLSLSLVPISSDLYSVFTKPDSPFLASPGSASPGAIFSLTIIKHCSAPLMATIPLPYHASPLKPTLLPIVYK